MLIQDFTAVKQIHRFSARWILSDGSEEVAFGVKVKLRSWIVRVVLRMWSRRVAVLSLEYISDKEKVKK